MPRSKNTQPEVVAQTVMLPLSAIETNKGQVEGLPKNPRVIKNEQYMALKKSIEDNPEMLTYRELLVYPHGGKYIVIGGNMRLKVMGDLGYKEAPCKVLPETATVEQLKAYVVKDNVSGGLWDWDALANEWEMEDLKDWGLEIPNFTDDVKEGSNSEIDCSDFSDKIELKFELSIDEHSFVRSELAKIDANKEIALLKILGYEE